MHHIRLFSLLLILSLLSIGAGAQVMTSTGDSKPAATAKPEKQAIPDTLKSPRATFKTFLEAMRSVGKGNADRIDDAISTLDLSEVNQLVRKERGSDLAWLLLEVIDRTRRVDLRSVPARTEGKPYLFKRYRNGDISIVRMQDGRWLFARETIANLQKIMDERADNRRVSGSNKASEYLPLSIRLRQQLPESLRKAPLLLENWQWIALFLVVLVGLVVDRLVSFLFRRMVRHWRERTTRPEYQNLSSQMLRPLGLMAMAMIWWVGINMLGLPESAMLVLLVAVKFLASISGVWAAYRLVDLASAHLLRRALLSENKLDDVLMPLIPRTLKVFVTMVGFVFIADNLNIDISSLLAGLGLGGLAFALAAKDMVQNIFGSITVLMDRTFTVGDWVIVDDIEGTVEQIGFRSTRIRTFYNSRVTVPNSRFITASVDNMGARRYRRLSCKLSLTYDTPPDRIEAFCEGVRELVRQHPYMRKDYFQVYLNEFAASSLDVLLYVFWETPDWNTELRERHRFLLDILRLASRLEVEFAFPTQTLYMKSDQPDEAAGAAELAREQALQMGREQAVKIVSETTGVGVRPAPVTFPPG